MDQAEKLRKEAKKRKKTESKVITITSGKGGVGKSNAAVNLAVWFRKMNKKVIIFDADFGLANVEVMFKTNPKYTLSDMIYNGVPIKNIITKGPMDIGFISGGSGIVALNNLTVDQLNYILRQLNTLSDLCDILIVDTGAGISDSVLKFVLGSPEVLVITTSEPSSITDAYSLIKALIKSNDYNKNTMIKIIANKVSSEEEGEQVYGKISAVTKEFLNEDLHYGVMIYNDNNLLKAITKQKVVSIEYPNSKSSKCYEKLANELVGSKVKSKGGIVSLFKFLTK